MKNRKIKGTLVKSQLYKKFTSLIERHYIVSLICINYYGTQALVEIQTNYGSSTL